jgi:hypothetical protein
MRPIHASLIALTLLGCGGSDPQPHDVAAPRALDEARFLEIAAGVLTEYQVTGEQNRPIQAVGVDGDFDADIGVRGKNVAIEYVSDADRVRLGGALPARAPAGALRVLAATDSTSGAPVDVLILEDTDYKYDPDPAQSGGRGPTVQEVEGRLERDLRDFMQSERQAGNL